jgi:hypothetical protein
MSVESWVMCRCTILVTAMSVAHFNAQHTHERTMFHGYTVSCQPSSSASLLPIDLAPLLNFFQPCDALAAIFPATVFFAMVVTLKVSIGPMVTLYVSPFSMTTAIVAEAMSPMVNVCVPVKTCCLPLGSKVNVEVTSLRASVPPPTEADIACCLDSVVAELRRLLDASVQHVICYTDDVRKQCAPEPASSTCLPAPAPAPAPAPPLPVARPKPPLLADEPCLPADCIRASSWSAIAPAKSAVV